MPEHPEVFAEARESIRNLTRDAVTRLLLRNSQLTLTQLETLLADSLSSENETKKSDRRLYRPSRARLSRGAYNRTLIQAQINVIRSIYTILLLGYLGLFDTPALQPFLELSDTVQGFVQETKRTAADNRLALQDLNMRLSQTISALAKRGSFKDAL